MTTSEKTKQKLVDSMRKTKAGSAKKQATAKKKVAAKRQVEGKSERMLSQQQDGYQSVRRVWPD